MAIYYIWGWGLEGSPFYKGCHFAAFSEENCKEWLKENYPQFTLLNGEGRIALSFHEIMVEGYKVLPFVWQVGDEHAAIMRIKTNHKNSSRLPLVMAFLK